MGPSGSGKSTLFSWMIGALEESFAPPANCGWITSAATVYPPSDGASASCSRTRCCSTTSASGKIYCWRLPLTSAAPSAKPRSNRRWSAPVWRGFIRAIRPPFPAASGRGSACCAPCWPDRGRCCWMSRLIASTLRCAPIFAAGCSTNWRGRRSRGAGHA
jgi:energy-coupling factor transporter ATP-binding protein EcfA2